MTPTPDHAPQRTDERRREPRRAGPRARASTGGVLWKCGRVLRTGASPAGRMDSPWTTLTRCPPPAHTLAPLAHNPTGPTTDSLNEGKAVRSAKDESAPRTAFARRGKLDRSKSWPTVNGAHIDQMSQVVEQIRRDPESRRHVVSAWNVGELERMALPPCHLLFQFYVARRRLSCQLYMRSADLFLGLPFNIASYSLLTMMIAQVCRLEPGGVRAHARGRAPLSQPSRAGRYAALARTLPPAHDAPRSGSGGALRLSLRALHARELPAPSGHPGSDRGVSRSLSAAQSPC